jgi:hypothetical protein
MNISSSSSFILNASEYDNKTKHVKPERVIPDNITFSSQFYAKGNFQIPSFQNRPGNNTINKELLCNYK